MRKLLDRPLEDLHDFLGFNGRVFLSTVMPDELIDKLRTEDYFKLIENLRPDASSIIRLRRGRRSITT